MSILGVTWADTLQLFVWVGFGAAALVCVGGLVLLVSVLVELMAEPEPLDEPWATPAPEWWWEDDWS